MIFLLLSSCSFLLKNNTVKIHHLTTTTKKSLNNIHKYNRSVVNREKINDILIKSGVNIKKILNIIKTDKKLNNLKVGQLLSWTKDPSGKLLELKWKTFNFQKKIYIKNNYVLLKKDILRKLIFIKKTIFIKKMQISLKVQRNLV